MADAARLAGVLARPTHAFPLVRQLSYRLTPWLLRTPLTPNQISVSAIAAGLAAAACWWRPGALRDVAGALLLVLAYALDNCDGEVARARRMESQLGRWLDSIGDQVVIVGVFAALGARVAEGTGHAIWGWAGLMAGGGVAVDAAVAALLGEEGDADARPQTDSLRERAAHFVWGLLDADFCFIAGLFVVAGWAAVLVAAMALGANGSWLFRVGSRLLEARRRGAQRASCARSML
jgi:phosphatidylglycerophosphate synthase